MEQYVECKKRGCLSMAVGSKKHNLKGPGGEELVFGNGISRVGISMLRYLKKQQQQQQQQQMQMQIQIQTQSFHEHKASYII